MYLINRLIYKTDQNRLSKERLLALKYYKNEKGEVERLIYDNYIGKKIYIW